MNGLAESERTTARRRPLGLRRGDVVEVLDEAAIRATLDERGCLDGLPFMAEMRGACGQRFRVFRRAERVCVEGTASLRRVADAVFLEGLRCDGAAHGGCKRGCLMLWKEAWLKRVRSLPEDGHGEYEHPSCDQVAALGLGDEALAAGGRAREATWFCQSTALEDASSPVGQHALRARLVELRTGDVSPGEFLLGALGALGRRGRRLANRLVVVVVSQARRSTPESRGEPEVPVVPLERLELRPGELVEVRSHDEIAATLDEQRKHRGLEFCPGMPAHCGKRYRVATRVDRIILEATGQMRPLRDTVTLEGVDCPNCARRNPFYWREAWLKRV